MFDFEMDISLLKVSKSGSQSYTVLPERPDITFQKSSFEVNNKSDQVLYDVTYVCYTFSTAISILIF